jgi:hypothetical protein
MKASSVSELLRMCVFVVVTIYTFLTLLFLSQAKNKVGQAKSKSANTTRQVEKALDDVQAIIEELNRLPNIGKMFLDILEYLKHITVIFNGDDYYVMNYQESSIEELNWFPLKKKKKTNSEASVHE